MMQLFIWAPRRYEQEVKAVLHGDYWRVHQRKINVWSLLTRGADQLVRGPSRNPYSALSTYRNTSKQANIQTNGCCRVCDHRFAFPIFWRLSYKRPDSCRSTATGAIDCLYFRPVEVDLKHLLLRCDIRKSFLANNFGQKKKSGAQLVLCFTFSSLQRGA